MRRCLLLGWLLAALLPAGLILARPAAPPSRPARLPDPAPGRVDFVKDVQPILTAFCVECHGDKKQKGGLRLDSRRAALADGIILPGKSIDSPFIHRVAGLGEEKRMPPKGAGLTRRQIALLRAWIDQGATWPDFARQSSTSNHWAYQPLIRPNIPSVKNPELLRNPIDAFVQSRLDSVGLSPAPPADKRTLIRRATFDLTGLPPTPAEIDNFLEDKSANAWEKVVDRLLGSPRYGERYARHWLDVIHFAETHGHDQDVPRENAWPYRDYLIRAFNDDRPYARFVEEQIAGDVLDSAGPDGIVATGMLAAGPWDESSQQSIREDTIDKKQAQNLDRDDMVTTALSAFSSATVHCARCHDHKFDPISQEEYYGLQAVFSGIDRANRPYDSDPGVQHKRLALRKRSSDLQSASAASLEEPEIKRAVMAWERERRGESWHILEPERVKTAKGSLPTTLPDRSVRFGGRRPEVDIYTISATTKLKGITAVRLELLTDDSLPHKGPGRQDNGNLHLNEFRIQAGPRSGATEKQRPVAIKSAIADFDQEGWTVAMAIDGKPGTAWGIYPAIGRAHQAVFELKEAIGFSDGANFNFTLEQTHGGGHLIGRLRLSVTTARPTRVLPLPEAISALIAVAPEKRTLAQRITLARHVIQEQTLAEIASLPPQQMVFAAASDFRPEGSFRPAKGCRPVQMLRRGDITQPIKKVGPAALSCVPGLPGKLQVEKADDEGARRVAFARWLTDKRNVLTWRSIVNRVWHHHFGRGIVATPSDLGRMGSAPSHPELLDFLAVEFRDQGGSLKKLHRLILTSASYQRSCRHDPRAAKVDGDNLLLWRMNRARLDAESVRDAVLSVSGKLDTSMGGPSVKHFKMSKGIHVTPNVDYASFDVDSPSGYRRSIYRFIFRTLPDPFLETLDCPDASQFTPARSSSITALQALAMLNDRFMVRQAEHFAARLQAEAGSDLADQIKRAYMLALGRPATSRETALLVGYSRRHGMASACRVILNCNEFLFVD